MGGWVRVGMRWGGSAVLAGLLSSSACAQPSVDALAAWLEAETPRLQLYDGGERRDVELRPTVPGSDGSRLQLAVVPGGRGVVISPAPPNDKPVWIDVRNGGTAVLDYGPWGKLTGELQIFESGLGLARRTVDDGGAVILPLFDGVDQPIWLERPTELDPSASFRLRSAAASPIFYLTELEQPDFPGINNRVRGMVRAYEMRGGRLLELGRAQLFGRASVRNPSDAIPGRCIDGACVSPDGSALVLMHAPYECGPQYGTPCDPPPVDCRLLRYRWQSDDGASVGAARAIQLPDDCDYDHDGDGENPGPQPHSDEIPRAGAPELIAALSDAVVLLEDDARIYRADLDARTWLSLPKLAPVVTPTGSNPMKLIPVDEGRGALLLAPNLQVIRADEQGLRIHSAEQMPCDAVESTVASPSGEWLLTICVTGEGGDGSVVDLEDAVRTVVRISVLGLEAYDGISMRALAIDDEGSALMYSFSASDNDEAPRGLFVLDADGKLSRVDTLEPAPQELITSSMDSYYFGARARIE